MSHGGKVAGAGLLAVLGLGVARSADNCTVAGMRGGRAAGELGEGALRGSKAVWGAEEAVRGSTRLGAEVSDDVLARARLLDGVSGVEAKPRSADIVGDALGEALTNGFEIGTEAFDLAGPSTGDGPLPGRTKCPGVVDATVSVDGWNDFTEGFGIACAPMIVIGTATDVPDALRIGTRTESVRDLATTCSSAGGHCLFVACDLDDAQACERTTETRRLAAPLHDDLGIYQTSLVAQLLLQDPAPAWIAVTSTRGPRRLRIARRQAHER